MKKKFWLPVGLSVLPMVFLALDLFELYYARNETAHLYPFGAADAGWFYKSLNHYRLFVGIDAGLAIFALAAVTQVYRGHKWFFVFYLGFLFWILFWILGRLF